MKTTVEKLGSGLAVRIPNAFARDTRLRDGSPVDVQQEGTRLVIQPAARKKSKLATLLRLATPARMHSEADWGAARGNEVW